ncbi:MAG TPA: DUF721 domain-containing protein [Ilumatobacteraceae bacterium]
MNDDDPIPLTAAIDDVVRALRGPGRREVGGVFGRWQEAVGDHVAAHVRPVKLDGSTLVVEVDEPAWATQVTLLSNTVKERLAAVAGVAVERLEVRVRRRR